MTLPFRSLFLALLLILIPAIADKISAAQFPSSTYRSDLELHARDNTLSDMREPASNASRDDRDTVEAATPPAN